MATGAGRSSLNITRIRPPLLGDAKRTIRPARGNRSLPRIGADHARVVAVCLVGLLAIAIGVYMAAWPIAALASIVLVIAVPALLHTVISWRSLAGAILLLCCSADLPTNVRVGPITGLAVQTIIIAAVCAGFILLAGREARWNLPIAILAGFVAWGIVGSITFSRLDAASAQNLLVYAVFVFAIVAGVTEIGANQRLTLAHLQKIFTVVTTLGIALYLATRFLPLGDALAISDRAFALLAMILIAWHASRWRYGDVGSMILSLLLLATVASSLSRTALAACVLIVALSRFRPLHFTGWLSFLGSVLLGAVGLYLAVTRIEPLRRRFFEGDLSLEIAGIPINAMGRATMWEIVLDSYRESPWIGKGVGSAQATIDARFPGVDGHPHNDYFRILHDFGALGMALWGGAFLLVVAIIIRAWLKAEAAGDQTGSVHLAALLAILGVAIAMLTDNIVIYVFGMAPLGILVGIALGLASRQNAAPLPERGQSLPAQAAPD